MTWGVRIQQVEAMPLAVVPAQAELSALQAVIPKAFDELYRLLRKEGVSSPGRNVVVYLDDVFNMEVGVVVPADFRSVGGLVRSATPAGRTAITRHVGPYSGLPQAHGALHAWCVEKGQELDGRSWEVYGDWSNDPSLLWTDIHYSLKGESV